MDHLWSPWRYRYVTSGVAPGGCIFCEKPKASDEESLLVYRGRYSYVILNLFPYASGHLMVVPNEHVSTLADCPAEALREMTALAQRAEGLLRGAYGCEGFNIGFNIGRCAGAGVAAHIHLHVVPRWTGDANFMTTIGETRTLPEELSETWRKLRALDWSI